MKKDAQFFVHTIAITALFILGNAVIILPAGNVNEFTFLAFILSLLVGILLLFPFSFLAKTVFCKSTPKNVVLKTGKILLLVFLCIFSLFTVSDAFSSFINFVKTVLLTNTPTFFITVIFAVTVLFFFLRKQEDVLKFFLICVGAVVIIILFFFLATSFDFNLRNIFVFSLPKVKDLLSQAKPYILNPALTAVILPFYTAAFFKRPRKSALFAGFFCGYILLGLCVIGSVLLLGSAFAGELPYPYSAAVSTVSIGRLFTRLDGFSYFVYFVCSLAKITVCLFVIKESLKKINSILKN